MPSQDHATGDLFSSVGPGRGRGRTLDEARQDVQQRLRDGSTCPCCDQFAKSYEYTLSQNNCRFLVQLYHIDRRTPGKFTHSDEMLRLDAGFRKSRDYNRLLYWTLIEEAPNADTEKKRHSGLWRITVEGRKFVERELAIPKYARVYNDTLLGFEGVQVQITDFQGEFFNYQEHMSRG